MKTKQEREFAALVNQDTNCQIDFDENSFWGTFDDGTSKEYPLWQLRFRGSPIHEGHCEDILECVCKYFKWSSQRIAELEAKLALAQTLNIKDKPE
jgi:hypothetical protein